MLVVVLSLVLIGPMLVLATGQANLSSDWRTADRSSQGIAPLPSEEARAVIQVYAARAYHWRGIFAVHPWIAVKPAGASEYVVYQVLGWQKRRGLPVVVGRTDLPDRAWYDNAPDLLLDIRGAEAARLIPKVSAAIASYPYENDYTLWPGPNSNSFVAHVAREVPDLRLELPTTAIGKDYLGKGKFFARAPSGTGWQMSLYGLFGLTLAREEGVEFNLLTANFGIDVLPLAIKLPGIGRIGFPQALDVSSSNTGGH